MTKYKYSIHNLDCANCAREIEKSLNKKEEFHDVSVNFSTCKLSFESEKNYTIKELNHFIQQVEPDAYLTTTNIEEEKSEYHLSILLLALFIGIGAYLLPLPTIVKTICYVLSYALLLYRTTINAIKLLLKGKGINENALITISCLGAFFLGEIMEGMMVIVLYTIGKILEQKAINNSRKSIKNLLDIKEPFANKKMGKEIIKIAVEEVQKGDILMIKKGEKIPVDGIITKGTSKLDMAALTGESELITVKEQDTILSGSINMGSPLEIKATTNFEDSTVAKILDLLESATDKKTKTETTISKISKIYTPIVITLAIIIIITFPIFFSIPLTESIHRALTFLVISCPCAIAISIPLSYFTGIGVASKNGILIKGSNYLDNLSSATSIIFDKTGTLTNGTFQVKDIIIEKSVQKQYTKDEIIDILRKGESLSTHPIATSIVHLKEEKVDNTMIKDFQEETGKGITFTLNQQQIKIGNHKLCHCENEEAALHLNIDGKHIASIVIDDGIKEHAKEVIQTLKSYQIKTHMFTGDKKQVALTIGKELNIDDIQYEMLPQDKFESYEKISNSDENKITVFVGDGINDAPVLKRADIGISMGGVGTDSAIEASDIVLMSDELDKIPLAIAISKYTKKVMKQNLTMAMTIKIVILFLSMFGLANMWMAVFADTGVTLLTIINTLKIMHKYQNEEGK